MEFEAVDEGKIAKILVPEGSEGVKVGAPIAILAGEGEDASAAARGAQGRYRCRRLRPRPAPEPRPTQLRSRRLRRSGAGGNPGSSARPLPHRVPRGDRIKASPLARRLAQAQGIDLSTLQGSGPGGRIVRADIDASCRQGACRCASWSAGCRSRRSRPHLVTAGADRAGDPARSGQAFEHPQDDRAPPDGVEAADPAHLSDRRHPARRAPEAAQRAQRRARKPRDVKLSVNDLLIKALAQALIEVPECNVASPATSCSNTAAPIFPLRCRSRRASSRRSSSEPTARASRRSRPR